MRNFKLIESLELTREGAMADNDLVHLMQGDADGACGPYSLLMCLIINGVISRDDAIFLHEADGRTLLGRFRDNLLAFGSLVKDGTTSSELDWLSEGFKKDIYVEVLWDKSTKQRADQIADALNKNNPVIVRADWNGGGAHWMVAVGYEIDSNHIVRKILTLDPASPRSNQCPWNGVIELFDANGRTVNSGNKPSTYWAFNDHEPVDMLLSEAVVIGRK